MSAALAKLYAARADLSRQHPVLGRLASFLDLEVEADLPCVVQSGAEALRWREDDVAQADAADLQFWLAHAALHAALGHIAPPPGAPAAWSQQCDAEVNHILTSLGFVLPKIHDAHDWWHDDPFEAGEAAPRRTSAASAEAPTAAQHRLAQASRWRARAKQAVGEALGSGEGEGVLLRSLLGHTRPDVAQDWHARLAAFMQRWQQTRSDYARPSRRAQPPFLLPALRPQAVQLVVAVDTSASIQRAQLQRFWSEIQALSGQMTLHLTLLAADTALAPGAPWVFLPGEVPIWPEPLGQGGTDFRPVFSWLAQQGEGADALIYFTDGKGDYPNHAPHVPVLWALSAEASDVRLPPFGEVIRL